MPKGVWDKNNKEINSPPNTVMQEKVNSLFGNVV